MNGQSIVSADYLPLGRRTLLLVPPWVRNPTALPWDTEEDRLRIEVSRRFSEEMWQILGSGPNTLAAYRQLGGGERLGDPLDVRFTVFVPDYSYSHFSVQTLKPG